MDFPQLIQTIKIVEKLLDPKEGCPWDLKQTHQTLLKYLIEETYEFIHATEENDLPHMEEELGDILLQVLLHSRIADKEKNFSLESVAQKLGEKLIFRHPHIFKEKQGDLTADDVLVNWQKLKEEEKKAKSLTHEPPKKYQIDFSLLNSPALISANKIGEKTAHLGLDWENYAQVLYKVEEEWQEIKEELPPSGEYNKERVADEIGDLLFSLGQLGRHLGIDPEESLRAANRKFIERFHIVEDLLREKGTELKDLSDEAKDELWMKAKVLHKQRKQHNQHKQ